ncbi:preprotein translocase subunit SecD [Sphingopyxis panaciterrae]|nr:preprotein translocase subunit SecD [Sphingopyxis panaciterrae]
MILALSLIAAPSLAAEPMPAAPATEHGQPIEPRCGAGDQAPECGPGIWIGPLAICGSQLVNARLSQDEWSGLPVLIIDLDGPLRAALAELTTNMVGRPLPLRFNGKTVIAPIVNEPITAGSLQISGSTLEELQVLQTTLHQCARSEGATL